MFKFVVLCAFFAAASADPAWIAPSLSYSAPAVVPAPAVYSSYPSNYAYSPSVLSAAPLAYSSPYGFAHYIKKRSLAVSSYIAPSTYVSSAPLLNSWTGAAYTAPFATTYGAPLATTYSSPLYTTAHLIKKRSAPLIVPSTYLASPYAAPLAPYVASSYGVSPIVSSPYYATAPLAYSHFIKKRSAPLAVAAYTSPASYSHQSRFDYQATSPAISTTYSTYSPSLVYSSPLDYSHLI